MRSVCRPHGIRPATSPTHTRQTHDSVSNERRNHVLDVNFFDELRIGLATADAIRAVEPR